MTASGSLNEGTGQDRGDPAIRRLVCVSANAAVDRIMVVDRLSPGEIHRAQLLSVLPGGKALNVARAATHLGLPASVVAVLAGRAGDWIADELAARRIAARRVAVRGESRTCTSVLDRATGLLTEFYEAGVTVDAGTWDALERALVDELATGSADALVVLAGSLPPGAPADGYRRLAALSAERGATVALDAGAGSLRVGLAARPWLVKVNAGEAAAALTADGGGEDPATTRIAPQQDDGDRDASLRAAAAIRSRGASVAILTLGAAGAVLACESGTWRVGPSPERGPYPVGSGDAFLAGFAAGVASSLGLPESARWAAAVASAHALVPGQGEFDLSTAERFRARVTLERVD